MCFDYEADLLFFQNPCLALQFRFYVDLSIWIFKGRSNVFLGRRLRVRSGQGLRCPSSEHMEEFRSVVIARQEVKNGVQTAVHAGEGTSDFISKVDNIKGLAVSVQNTVGIVQRACDVEGHKTDRKHN